MSLQEIELFYQEALLPSGWAENVLINIDSFGTITSITTNVKKHNITLKSGVILPGIPNIHSHSHQKALAGLTENPSVDSKNFWGWRDLMYKFIQKLHPNDLEIIAQYVYLEMLKAGYTSVAEFQYLHKDLDGNSYTNPAEMSLATLAAANYIGIGFTILPVLYQYSDFDSKTALKSQNRFINSLDDFIKIFEILKLEANNHNKINIGVAPHSLRAVNKDMLTQVLKVIKTQKIPIHIHIAEQKKEVLDCINWSGLRPIEWLFDNFDIDESWCLIHATHMNKLENKMLATSQAIAGLCPTTEANLGDGLFDALDFFNSGGYFGIGSDSNITINPFDELRFLEYGQRLIMKNRNLLCNDKTKSTGRNLYELAAIGGGKALRNKSGKIAVGYKADLIVIDTSIPSLISKRKDAILDTLIFSNNQHAIKDVFVNGDHVISKGQHKNEKEIISRYRVTMKKFETL